MVGLAQKSISIIGCGWLGLALAEQLTSEYDVKGSTTQSSKLKLLASLNIRPFLYVADNDQDKGENQTLFNSDLIIITLPPGIRQGADWQSYPQKINSIIQKVKDNPVKHIIFTSSTGVYPDNNAEVSENAEIIPQNDKQRALKAAEDVIQASGLRFTILRLAGLVGGDRKPGRWFAGQSDVPGGMTPVNMVHREDVIRAILELIEKESQKSAIYNLCASEHPIKENFYTAQSKKMGLNPAHWQATKGPYKLIKNDKFINEFSFSYLYPNPILF